MEGSRGTRAGVDGDEHDAELSQAKDAPQTQAAVGKMTPGNGCGNELTRLICAQSTRLEEAEYENMGGVRQGLHLLGFVFNIEEVPERLMGQGAH
eukprot:1092590-Pyramimonas_sp.AAC.1